MRGHWFVLAFPGNWQPKQVLLIGTKFGIYELTLTERGRKNIGFNNVKRITNMFVRLPPDTIVNAIKCNLNAQSYAGEDNDNDNNNNSNHNNHGHRNHARNRYYGKTWGFVLLCCFFFDVLCFLFV